MIYPEKCFRCDTRLRRNDSGEHYFSCQECYLHYNLRSEVCYFIFKVKNKYHSEINWYHRRQCCKYYCYSPIGRSNVIQVPWLPYDITLDKLKLYLTFL